MIELLTSAAQDMDSADSRSTRSSILASLEGRIDALANLYVEQESEAERLLVSLQQDGTYTRARALLSSVKQRARVLRRERRDQEIAAGPSGTEPEVWSQLDLNREGRARNTDLNLARILDCDTRLDGQIRSNEFSGKLELWGSTLSDVSLTRSLLWLSEHYGIEPARASLKLGLERVGASNSYHPVRDWLCSLEWDGVARLDSLVGRWIVPREASSLASTMGRKWMVSAAARGVRPGVQVDSVLILCGAKGIGKSSFFRSLAWNPDWFSDSYLSIGSKDSDIALRGTWIRELAELEAIRKKDSATLKAWISRREDSYRPPYGYCEITVPRGVVFCGSSNETAILGDVGNRRFWPILVEAINQPNREEVCQLWAEAVDALHSGEQWHLSAEEQKALDALSVQFEQVDPWEGPIVELITRSTGQLALKDILDALGFEGASRTTRTHGMRIDTIMSRLGFERARIREGNRRRTGYQATKSRE